MEPTDEQLHARLRDSGNLNPNTPSHSLTDAPSTITPSTTSDIGTNFEKTLTGDAGADIDYDGLFGNALRGMSGAFEDRSEGIMDRYKKRQEKAQESFEAGQELTKNEFADLITEQGEANEKQILGLQESRRGFAMNTGIFKAAKEEGRKRINDLEKRRDALLLQGKADHADRMDNLIADEEEALTTARQNYITNLFNLSAEIRAQRSFETPEEARQREVDIKRDETMEAYKLTYADVEGVRNAQNLEELLIALGPRLSEDRKAELARLALDDDYKRAQIDYQKALASAARADAANTEAGNVGLDDVDLARVDKTDEAKKLRSMFDLRTKMKNYERLINQYGYGIVGTEKTLLDNAYTTLQIAWKEAAELGALQGPDMGLILAALKPVSGMSGIGTWAFGGGKDAVLKQLEQGFNNMDTEAQEYYARLIARDPRYAQSEYIQRLGDPFFTDTAPATEPAAPIQWTANAMDSGDRMLQDTVLGTSTYGSTANITPSFIADE